MLVSEVPDIALVSDRPVSTELPVTFQVLVESRVSAAGHNYSTAPTIRCERGSIGTGSGGTYRTARYRDFAPVTCENCRIEAIETAGVIGRGVPTRGSRVRDRE